MKNFGRRGLIFFCLMLLLCNLRCATDMPKDSDHDGVTDEFDNCRLDPGPKSNKGCPIPSSVKQIHLYLDNSASMGGYYQIQTEYKNIVSDLAVKMDKFIAPVNLSFIAEKEIPYRYNVAAFSESLATSPLATQRSSELDNMIKTIASHCDDHEVSLLVSDCILSFSPAAIRKQPDINLYNASSTLKNNIFGTFADLRKKGFAASLFAFQSKFYGTYYDYQNHKIKLNGVVRPFYIWAIAKPALLARFSQQLNQISTFRPDQSLHFGLAGAPVKSFTILPELERKGDWLSNAEGLSDVNLSSGQNLQFSVFLNLDRLPAYARDPAYLKRNLKISSSNCSAQLWDVKNKIAFDATKLTTEHHLQVFEQVTHGLVFQVSAMPLPTAKIRFVLPLKDDDWWHSWTTMNDRLPDSSAHRTFALQYLIAGVKEAYEQPGATYIDGTILLAK